MIYEYEKSDKTHLFEVCGVKSNITKKIESWRYDKKWMTKIKEAHSMEI